MKVRFLPPARVELVEAIGYYEAQVSGLGSTFAHEIKAALTRIDQFPTAWQSLSPRTRRYLLRQFPYGVIYAVRDNEIVVVAIAHQHRKPDYWKNRLS